MPARLFIGTSGWNYYDWKGRFYPKDKIQSKLSHSKTAFKSTAPSRHRRDKKDTENYKAPLR